VQEEEGYGLHAFRRWRETDLRLEGVPQPIVDLWIGHGKKTISDVYTKIKLETAKRRTWCEQARTRIRLHSERGEDRRDEKVERKRSGMSTVFFQMLDMLDNRTFRNARKSLKRMAPRAGLEPATFRLTAERSTIELPGNCAGIRML
jgi:hypothetical protein